MRFVALNTDVDGYKKYRNYWEYLKAKMKRENNQVGSVTTRFPAQRGYGEPVECPGLFCVFRVFRGSFPLSIKEENDQPLNTRTTRKRRKPLCGCEAAGSVFSVLAGAVVMGRSNKGICHKIFVG